MLVPRVEQEHYLRVSATYLPTNEVPNLDRLEPRPSPCSLHRVPHLAGRTCFSASLSRTEDRSWPLLYTLF